MKTNLNLIESLDVGGRPVVSDGDDLGLSKLHAESGSHLVQTPDEILGYITIPSKKNLILARDIANKYFCSLLQKLSYSKARS